MKKLTLVLLLITLAIGGVWAQSFSQNDYGSGKDSETNLYYFYKRDTNFHKTPLTKAEFENTGNFSYGLAMAKKNGKYGYIDTLGHVAIEFKYDNATTFTDSVAIVFYDCKTGIIDLKGNLNLLKKEYEQVLNFSNDRAVVIDKYKCGVIDKKGNEIVAPQYYTISGFNNGVSVYTETLFGKRGVIDTMGNIVIPCEYDGIDDFVNGTAIAAKRMKVNGRNIRLKGLIDTHGKILVPINYTAIDKGDYMHYDRIIYRNEPKPIVTAVKVRHHRRYDYFDIGDNRKLKITDLYTEKGKLIVSVPKQHVEFLTDTLYYFKFDKGIVLGCKTGTFDTLSGIKELNPFMSYIENDSLIATLGYNKKQGLITRKGQVVFAAKYNYITGYNHGQFIQAYTGDTTEFYNPKTLVLIGKVPGLVYAQPNTLTNGKTEKTVRIVIQNGKKGLVDENLNIILPVEYDDINCQSNCVIIKKDKKYGLLNNQLNVVIPPIYNEIETAFNWRYARRNEWKENPNFIIVKSGKKYGLVTVLGNTILPTEYSNISYTWINNILHFKLEKDKKWGIVDSTGRTLMELKYDYVSATETYIVAGIDKKKALFTTGGKQVTDYLYTGIYMGGHNYLQVYIKNKAGLMDASGKVIVPVQYRFAGVYGDYISAYKKNITTLYNSKGEVVIGPEYGFTNIQTRTENNNFIVQKGKYYGLMARDKTELLPVVYSSIYNWKENGVFELIKGFRKKRRYGVATFDGKIIIPADYLQEQIDYHRETIVLTVDDKRYFYNAKGETVNDCYIDKEIGDKNYNWDGW